jgi:uncharacterized protein YtpQ (UPF0354 family)
MAELSREQFLDQVVTQVRTKFPLVKLSRSDSSFSLKVNGHTASLENLYRISVLRPEEIQHNVDRWIVELIRAAEGSPDQSGKYEDLKDRIFPMVLSKPNADVSGPAMVTQPLISGLLVAYAVDQDRTISYIPKKVFESWNMTIDDLHTQALENLVQRSEAMAAHAAQDEDGSVSLILFQTMDGYDASRILLPTLHERLRQYLGSPFVAGIPNRDILLCFRNEEETVTRMRSQIQVDFKQMPHQVTDRLMLVTADGIAPYEDEGE